MKPAFFFAVILPVLLWLHTETACSAEGASNETPPTTRRATFCNPLNLDYGWSAKGYRHAADPVIVLFQDRYYLFTTWDVAGCRVSDNLVDWRYVPFADDAMPRMTGDGRGYCAPAVAVHGDWLYFINMQPCKADKTCTVMRSREPLSGRWE